MLELPVLIDKVEAARLLGGVSTRTVMRMVQRGELVQVNLGRRVFITRENLNQYFRSF